MLYQCHNRPVVLFQAYSDYNEYRAKMLMIRRIVNMSEMDKKETTGVENDNMEIRRYNLHPMRV